VNERKSANGATLSHFRGTKGPLPSSVISLTLSAATGTSGDSIIRDVTGLVMDRGVGEEACVDNTLRTPIRYDPAPAPASWCPHGSSSPVPRTHPTM